MGLSKAYGKIACGGYRKSRRKPKSTPPRLSRYSLSIYEVSSMSPEKSLSIPPVAQRDKASFEVLRVWIAEQGQHVSIRSGAWEDPFAWGIVLADLARP